MTVQGQNGMMPVGVTGPIQVTQPTAANLNATVVGLGAAGGPTGGVLSTQIPDTTGSGLLNALNAAVQVALAGSQSVGFQLLSGTLIGTIVPEISFDGGTTWNTSFFDDPATGSKASTIVFSSANGTTGKTIVGAGGASHARVRVSAFTSGSANCAMRASQVRDPSTLFDGPIGVTGAMPPTAAMVGGIDASNTLRSIITDVNGLALTGNFAYAAAVARISGAYVGHTVGFNSSGSAGQLSATAYTEQTSAAIRSLKSASASDASAGTGAQQVTVVGFDGNMNRLTEVVSMNGTTAVATVNSYRFIESLIVTRAGSGGVNAGVITLYVNNAGGGGTITTIGTGSIIAGGDNQTFLGMHYVQTGKTCYIVGIQWDNTGVESSFTTLLRVINPIATGPAETTLHVGPGARYGGYARSTEPTSVIAGPARIRFYRASTSGNLIDASFDWVEF
jgi:hypothetical protein